MTTVRGTQKNQFKDKLCKLNKYTMRKSVVSSPQYTFIFLKFYTIKASAKPKPNIKKYHF